MIFTQETIYHVHAEMRESLYTNVVMYSLVNCNGFNGKVLGRIVLMPS